MLIISTLLIFGFIEKTYEHRSRRDGKRFLNKVANFIQEKALENSAGHKIIVFVLFLRMKKTCDCHFTSS